MTCTIMVVNNSKTILEMFKEILSGEGHKVQLRLFEEQEMLPEINAVKPNLVIIDCSAGKESQGWELLQQLRLEHTTQYLPVILCSTEYHLFEEMYDFLETKRVVTLAKPFDIDELLVAIEQAFKVNQLTGDHNNNPAIAGAGS